MGSSASKSKSKNAVTAVVTLSHSRDSHSASSSSSASSSAKSSARSSAVSRSAVAEKTPETKSDMASKGDGSGDKTVSANKNTTQTEKVSSTENARKKKKWQIVQPLSDLTDTEDDWWTRVDDYCEKSVPVIAPVRERKTWKTVRLFISSTFKDMNNERELLVKTVIPSLRQWCEDRKLRLIECDLRWGVPKDTETNDTLMACMSELDRCREENELPYMLVMMSERYGFVPKPEDVSDEIKARYKWLPGMSVTSLEEFTGGYWDLNPKILFMMRNDSFLKEINNSQLLVGYEDRDPKLVESLRILKGKIREKFADQVHEYSVQVDRVEDAKVIFSGLEDFAKAVMQHFMSVIDQQYPSDYIHEPLSDVEITYANHLDFVIQRGQNVQGREEQQEKSRKYLSTPCENPGFLLYSGNPGAGKSSLMASSVLESMENKSYKVFFHFVGATPNSTSMYSLMARMYKECLREGDEEMPVDLDEMMRYVPTLFQRSTEYALSDGYSLFVMYIDALNQLDDEGGVHKMAWLPRKLPKGMRLIVSSLEGECHSAMVEHCEPPEVVYVLPLDEACRSRIIADTLAEYNKRLDDEQMEHLVKKEDAGRPLYLTTACEELRVFGEFRKLTQKICDLPDDLSGLLETVMRRVIKEYGEELVEATLCLLETSRYGLSEDELKHLLAKEPILPRQATSEDHPPVFDEKIAMMKWALVYLGLKQFLRPCGSSDEGLLDFYHRTVSKVVRSHYLKKEADCKWYHMRLVSFFNQRTMVSRKADELPYHYVALEDMDGLRNCLLQRDVLEHLCQGGHRQMLMKHWQMLGGYEEASKCYTEFLKNLWKEDPKMGLECREGRELAMKVVWLLIDLGEFKAASTILKPMIDMIQKTCGEMAKDLADPLYAMMTLLYRRGLSFVYNSHPEYRECRRLGDYYVELCEKVHRKYYDSNDNHLGLVFTNCGYFKNSLLPESQKIFTSNNNNQGLAIVLYMLGEKNQYARDMNVPINYFEQSLKLCLSAFGKFHLHTARCYQLYGQLFWNRGCESGGSAHNELINRCLPLYQMELEILEEIVGANHPTTVRSREDVIIILQTLKRNGEAEVLSRQQPENNTIA